MPGNALCALNQAVCAVDQDCLQRHKYTFALPSTARSIINTAQTWLKIYISFRDAKCRKQQNFLSSSDRMTRNSSFAVMLPLMIARRPNLPLAAPAAQAPPFLRGAAPG